MLLHDSSAARSNEATLSQYFELRDDLHWLPIKQQIDFEIGVLSFKVMNGFAPPYLVGMFTPVTANPALSRNRSADRGDLIIQIVKNMSYGHRSFAKRGPYF